MRCLHNSGWYVESVAIVVSSDGLQFTLHPDWNRRGARLDKVTAVCNLGCGAERNVYLETVNFKFGNIRPKRPHVE